VADVRDYEATKTAVDAGVAELGRLDIVSANAGIATAGPSHELSAEAWREMIDINLNGVYYTCKAAIPHIIAGGRGGSMILTSSTAGIKGFLNLSHYAAAKHGIIGLMKSLANELAPHSIRVNTVNPTTVDTIMVDNQEIRSLWRPDLEMPTREDVAEGFMDMNALPVPWIEVSDVTNAVLFLASDEARYITGVVLPVDAGATQK
jgi:(+)-trans-carveol dehydrogenase